MQVDYERILAEVREDCGSPDLHAPTDDQIIQKAGDIAQLLMNQMGNAPPGWSQQYRDLPVIAGKSIYTLAGWDNFTKPVRVHSIDAADRNHINRKVVTCERQNVDEYYDGRTQSSEGGWSAQVMIFYRQYDVQYVEVLPAPAEAVSYRVWYNTGLIEDPTREAATPVPPEYFRFLRLKTAVAVLPHCLWAGKDDPLKFKKLLGSVGTKKIPGTGLLGQVCDYATEWENFIQSSRVTGSQGQDLYLAPYLNSWF